MPRSPKWPGRILLSCWRAPQILFIFLASATVLFNTTKLYKEIKKTQATRANIPYVFTGVKFTGLKSVLNHAEYIGYYTDKDLDNRQDAAQFAQAQYILAPIILDLNNTDHEYILFDCSSLAVTLDKIQELGILPMRRNQFGIVLARNPQIPLITPRSPGKAKSPRAKHLKQQQIMPPQVIETANPKDIE
jgi:hypothetical protein